MKTSTIKETTIICVSAVAAVAILSVPLYSSQSAYPVLIVLIGVLGLGIALGYKYLVTKKRVQVELTGGAQYRELAEEYRRKDHTGSIDVAFAAAPHQLSAIAGTGRVSVRVPSGTAYQINASSNVGSVHVSVPHSPTATHVITAITTTGAVSVSNA